VPLDAGRKRTLLDDRCDDSTNVASDFGATDSIVWRNNACIDSASVVTMRYVDRPNEVATYGSLATTQFDGELEYLTLDPVEPDA
jgi:hypothetical protein